MTHPNHTLVIPPVPRHTRPQGPFARPKSPQLLNGGSPMVDVAFFGALAACALAATFILAAAKILMWPTRQHINRSHIKQLVNEIHEYLEKH